jgi:hypothetical protein
LFHAGSSSVVEEEGVGVEDLVELELVPLRPPVEPERPAPAVEPLGAAGVLHHAVQRHELRDDELPHVVAPVGGPANRRLRT